MARPVRRPTPPKHYFAFLGRGSVAPKNIKAMLDDYIDGLGAVTPYFLLSAEKDDLTDTATSLVDYAVENNYAYAVSFTKVQRSKVFKDFTEDAGKKLEATDGTVFDTLIAEIEDPETAKLLFAGLGNDKDGESRDTEDVNTAFWAFADAGITILDFTSGLEVIPTDDSEGEGDAPVEEEGGGDDDDEGGSDKSHLPPRKEVEELPIRRLRALAIKEGSDTKEINEWAEEATRDELVGYIFEDPEPSGDEPEPEEEKPARSARAVRQSAEDDGETPNAPAVKALRGRRGAAKATEEPADEAQTEVSSSDLGAIRDAGGVEEIVRMSLKAFANEMADVIIDRIAARVQPEPAEAPEREVIAPKRRGAGRPKVN